MRKTTYTRSTGLRINIWEQKLLANATNDNRESIHSKKKLIRRISPFSKHQSQHMICILLTSLHDTQTTSSCFSVWMLCFKVDSLLLASSLFWEPVPPVYPHRGMPCHFSNSEIFAMKNDKFHRGITFGLQMTLQVLVMIHCTWITGTGMGVINAQLKIYHTMNPMNPSNF